MSEESLIAPKGKKGFTESGYNVKALGDAIAQTLFRKEKVTGEQRSAYLKEIYPKVMEFFRENDLRPTIENIVLNKDALKAYASTDSTQKAGATSKKRKRMMLIVFFIILIIVVVYIYFKKQGAIA